MLVLCTIFFLGYGDTSCDIEFKTVWFEYDDAVVLSLGNLEQTLGKVIFNIL